MLSAPLFAVAPLALAAVPVAAVPQRWWNAYCIEASTVTETVSLQASTLASDDPQAATTPETVTQTETVTLYSSVTVTPTVEAGSLSTADAADLPPRPTRLENDVAKTVTVLSTVTAVSTVTLQHPKPTESPSSASESSSDPTSEESPDPTSEDSPDATSAASPDSASDPETSSTSTATALPPALIIHPYYGNGTKHGPYDNSSRHTNTSDTASSAFITPTPFALPNDNSSQPTNTTDTASPAMLTAAAFASPYDNSSQPTNTSDTDSSVISPPIITPAAFASPYDNSSQVANTTDTSSTDTSVVTDASFPSDSSSIDTASSTAPTPSVSVPIDNSSQITTTSGTDYPPPTANPTAFGSDLSAYESATDGGSQASFTPTTFSTYDSTYVPTDTWTADEQYQSTSGLASDTSSPATPTPSISASYESPAQARGDTDLPAAPTATDYAYGAYENGLYFTNWGIYAADYQPQSLPTSLITRVIYAFADFSSNGTVFSSDTYADLENQYPTDPLNEPGNNAYGCVKQLFLLKKQNRHLKVVLSIGGWTYSTNFPAVAADPVARLTFAASAVQLVTDWGFDGVEIDWEYPMNADEAANFVLLVATLRAELDAWTAQNAPGYRFLITIASPAAPVTYGILDLAGMDAYVDSWNLMAYDYAGSWDTTTGHQANLYPLPNNSLATKFNTNQAVDDYIAAGATASKIVLGMPTFGRSFEATTGLGQPFNGVGAGSARLKQPGLWLYRELPRDGATELYDDVAKASYSYNNATRELISYDNVHSAKVKRSFMLSKGLGGLVFWEASGDKSGTESLVAAVAEDLSGIVYPENLLSYNTSQYDNIRNGVPGS